MTHDTCNIETSKSQGDAEVKREAESQTWEEKVKSEKTSEDSEDRTARRWSRASLVRAPLGKEERRTSNKGRGVFKGKSGWKLILKTYKEFISCLLFWVYLNTFFSK